MLCIIVLMSVSMITSSMKTYKFKLTTLSLLCCFGEDEDEDGNDTGLCGLAFVIVFFAIDLSLAISFVPLLFLYFLTFGIS